jgi:hypothetical protein
LRPGWSTTTLNAATAHSQVTRPSAGCYQPDGRVHLDRAVHESTVAGAHWGNRLLACSDPALTSSKRSACGPRR